MNVENEKRLRELEINLAKVTEILEYSIGLTFHICNVLVENVPSCGGRVRYYLDDLNRIVKEINSEYDKKLENHEN